MPAVALCAQQGLALRGHRKVESEDNEDNKDGNFRSYIKEFRRNRPFSERSSATWVKKQPKKILENPEKMINCIADCVRKEIIKQIQDFNSTQ